MAVIATVVWGTPSVSAMMNAAAPITGGRIWPPTEAVDSTAPAKVLEYPTFVIIGIVKAPVDTTLAIADPLIEPMKPEAMAATLAGPPRVWPAMASARSLNRVDIPDLARKAPKRINKIM